MFNFGGMLAGIGVVAEGAVKFNRSKKHDEEMLNMREALRKKALIEARDYSRQEELRLEKKEIRKRGEYLKQFLDRDEVIADLAKNEYAFQGFKDLQDALKTRMEETGEVIPINTFYDVQYAKDKINVPDAIKGEQEKFTLAGSNFYDNPNQQLGFKVVQTNNKLLAKKLSVEEEMAKMSETMNSLNAQISASTDETEKRKLQEELTRVEKSYYANADGLAKTIAFQNATSSELSGPDALDPEDGFKLIKTFKDQIKAEMDFIVDNPSAHNKVLFDIVDRKISVGEQGEVRGNQIDRIIFYNHMKEKVVGRFLNAYKDAEGNYKKQHLNKVNFIQSYFKDFVTGGKVPFYGGQVYNTGTNIPTNQYAKFIAGLDIDPNIGNQDIIANSPNGPMKQNLTQDKIRELLQRMVFDQPFTGQR